jgi:hypothetical protein
MTKEANLWLWLTKPAGIPPRDLHMDRVENYLVAGMPDVEGQLLGAGQFWIELKVCRATPRRESTPARFKTRKAQVEWLERRWNLGGNAWLLLQVGGERFLVPGSSARAVHWPGLTLGELRARTWTHPKARAHEVILMAARPEVARYGRSEFTRRVVDQAEGGAQA